MRRYHIDLSAVVYEPVVLICRDDQTIIELEMIECLYQPVIFAFKIGIVHLIADLYSLLDLSLFEGYEITFAFPFEIVDIRIASPQMKVDGIFEPMAKVAARRSGYRINQVIVNRIDFFRISRLRF